MYIPKLANRILGSVLADKTPMQEVGAAPGILTMADSGFPGNQACLTELGSELETSLCSPISVCSPI